MINATHTHTRTELVADEAELVDVVVAREERLAGQELCEDAAHRLKSVGGWGVVLGWSVVEGGSGRFHPVRLRPSLMHVNTQIRTHMSMALVYSWQASMISGARYQRVTTYSVRSCFCLG